MVVKRKADRARLKTLHKALKGSQSLPHLSELAEHFVNVSGGPRAVAKLMHTEWEAAPAGSLIRTRILDLLTRVWKFASEDHTSSDELGLLSDTDLERLLDDTVERLRAKAPEAPELEEVLSDGAGI